MTEGGRTHKVTGCWCGHYLHRAPSPKYELVCDQCSARDQYEEGK